MIQTGIVSVTMSKFEYPPNCYPSFLHLFSSARLKQKYATQDHTPSHYLPFLTDGCFISLVKSCAFSSAKTSLFYFVLWVTQWNGRVARFLWHFFPCVYVCVCVLIVWSWSEVLFYIQFVLLYVRLLIARFSNFIHSIIHRRLAKDPFNPMEYYQSKWLEVQ